MEKMTAEELWRNYSRRNNLKGIGYEAWAFGDDPDKLADLVLQEMKTATSSLYALYELEQEPLPEAEEYSVILDSHGEAKCIIRNTKVDIIPYNQISEEHAYKEGEGDRSLAYWKQVHERFFTEECKKAGISFAVSMDVVCEEFEVVYTDSDASSPEKRIVDDDITLIPYYPNYDVALAWYQDLELCKQVDNIDYVYTLDRLKSMYDYLSTHGDCYYIEYKNQLVGDITLKGDEISIVICREYQNRHIGRRCIQNMIELAREKGLLQVKAEIYSFNTQSQKMFLSVGFKKTEDDWYVYPIL